MLDRQRFRARSAVLRASRTVSRLGADDDHFPRLRIFPEAGSTGNVETLLVAFGITIEATEFTLRFVSGQTVTIDRHDFILSRNEAIREHALNARSFS